MDYYLNKYPPKKTAITEKDSSVINRDIKVNNLKIESTIDLHYMTCSEAISTLDSFIKSCYNKKMSKILVIHGKGLHSENNDSILKKTVLEYLNKNPLVYKVWFTKLNKGGAGASEVILKN